MIFKINNDIHVKIIFEEICVDSHTNAPFSLDASNKGLINTSKTMNKHNVLESRQSETNQQGIKTMSSSSVGGRSHTQISVLNSTSKKNITADKNQADIHSKVIGELNVLLQEKWFRKTLSDLAKT